MEGTGATQKSWRLVTSDCRPPSSPVDHPTSDSQWKFYSFQFFTNSTRVLTGVPVDVDRYPLGLSNLADPAMSKCAHFTLSFTKLLRNAAAVQDPGPGTEFFKSAISDFRTDLYSAGVSGILHMISACCFPEFSRVSQTCWSLLKTPVMWPMATLIAL